MMSDTSPSPNKRELSKKVPLHRQAVIPRHVARDVAAFEYKLIPLPELEAKPKQEAVQQRPVEVNITAGGILMLAVLELCTNFLYANYGNPIEQLKDSPGV